MLTNCLAACAHLTITVTEIYSEILVENRQFFSYPLAFDAPVRGFPLEQRHPVWYGKLEWFGYHMVKNFEDIFIRFGATHERDRQTGRQTDTACWQQPRYAQHRTAKTVWLLEVKKSLRICLFVSTQYTNMTDAGQTDRHRTKAQAASNETFAIDGSRSGIKPLNSPDDSPLQLARFADVLLQDTFACCTPTTRTSLSSTCVVSSYLVQCVQPVIQAMSTSTLASPAQPTSAAAACSTTCVIMVTMASLASLPRPASMPVAQQPLFTEVSLFAVKYRKNLDVWEFIIPMRQTVVFLKS